MTNNLTGESTPLQPDNMAEVQVADLNFYPLPAVLLNPSGQIVAANHLFEALTARHLAHLLMAAMDDVATLVSNGLQQNITMLLQNHDGCYLDDCQLLLPDRGVRRVKLVLRRFLNAKQASFLLTFSDVTDDFIQTHLRLRIQERLKHDSTTANIVPILHDEILPLLLPGQFGLLLFKDYELQQQLGNNLTPLLVDPTYMPQLLALQLHSSAAWRIHSLDYKAVVVGVTSEQQKILLVFSKSEAQAWPDYTAVLTTTVASVIADHQRFSSELHQLRELAFKDTLTGLPNRHVLMTSVAQLLIQARDAKQQLALMFIDIDGLKKINDTYGHLAGDDYLKQLANRLQLAAGAGAILARYAGDEFIVVLPLDDKLQLTTQVQQLTASVLQPLLLQGQHLFAPSMSMGVSIFPDDANDLAELMRKADLAKYQAKQDVSANHYFFRNEMASSAERRTHMEQQLRSAIHRGGLQLYYQPQYGADSQQICGAEALLRWPTAQGFISPAEFVPLAEKNGFINELTFCAAAILQADLKSWLTLGKTIPPISFNLSPLNLETPGFAEHLHSLFAYIIAAGVPMTLELTERAFIVEEEVIQQNLAFLVSQGYRVALDDFGVGYSSLLSLRKFPIHCLKLDKSFIDDITDNPLSRRILSDLFRITQTLDITALAEGVETVEQFEIVRAAGFQQIQGYYFSKPLSAEHFVAALN